MPLAFSSNAFKKNSLAQAIDSIACIGYRAVELMADLHHAHPLSFDAHRRFEIKKRLTDLGLVISNVNAFTHFVDGDTYNPTWIDDDASRVKVRIEHTKRSIEMAAEFGPPLHPTASFWWKARVILSLATIRRHMVAV